MKRRLVVPNSGSASKLPLPELLQKCVKQVIDGSNANTSRRAGAWHCIPKTSELEERS